MRQIPVDLRKHITRRRPAAGLVAEIPAARGLDLLLSAPAQCVDPIHHGSVTDFLGLVRLEVMAEKGPNSPRQPFGRCAVPTLIRSPVAH